MTAPTVLDIRIEDHRDFAGAYTSLEWRPRKRLRIDAGVRLNITTEKQEAGDAAEESSNGEKDNRQTNTRASGSIGVIRSAWEKNSDALRLFCQLSRYI